MTKIREIPAEEQGTFADALSSKCRNGLIIHFKDWRIIHQPQIIARVGCSGLKRSKYLSRESLQEIAEVLNEFGYIKCPYKWLKG